MRRLLLLFTLCSGIGLQAQPSTSVPEITADVSEADFATGSVVYRGRATARLRDAVLTADELRYRVRDRTVEARGNVILVQADRRLLAHEMVYNFDTRAFRVRDLRFGQLPLYASGAVVEGDPDALAFADATVTYGEPGAWSPTFVADRVTFYPDRERVRAEGARVGFGGWQFLPLPSTDVPTHISFLSYLSLDAGYSRALGAFAEVGVHLPVGGLAQLGGSVGLFTQRGLLIGPSGNYAAGAGTDRSVRGSFQTGFIHDNGERLSDILGRPVPKDRGWISWEHEQQWGERLTLAALLNYWSDSEVVRDFRPEAFFPVQAPDTFAELTYLGDNSVLGLFLRAQPNPYHGARQRLPELTFALLPSPLLPELGLYQEAQASASILRDDPPLAGPTLKSERFDGYYAISRPFTPQDWLTLRPVVGGRLTHYARALGGRSDYTRALGEVGFDAELRASGTFAYRNERWGIDGLRHLVTPRLSYRYIPDATRGEAHIPPIDRRVFATYLEPLGLGDRRQIDDLSATNTLRLSLDNRLQTRDPVYGSRDLVAVNVAADARFDRETGQRTWSDLHSELRLTPARWLAFDFYHRLETDHLNTEEFNTGLSLLHADQWTLRVGSHYLAGDIQEHVAGFTYRLNEVYQLFTRLHYDARRDRFNEQRYGLTQVIANRWIIGYEFSFFEGRRRESNFGFNLLFEALGF